MCRKLRAVWCVVVGVGLLIGRFGLTPVQAGPVNTFDDIEFWVGTGSNQAALVIDLDGNGPAPTYVWGYRWDGLATSADMLQALARQNGLLGATDDPRLFFFDDGGGGPGTVYGFGYDLNGNGIFGLSPAAPSMSDNRVPADSGDVYSEGWFTAGYWELYVYEGVSSSTAPTTLDWTSSLVGINDRVLQNNSWDGWRFQPNFQFPGNPPGGQLEAAPVPEPTTWVMLGGGLLLAGAAARRSRRVAA